MVKRALVVSHDASYTGAPRVAVEVTRALIGAGWTVEVVLRWPGPLRPAFEEAGGRVVLEPMRRVRALLRLWPRTRFVANWLDQVGAMLALGRFRPDMVWCNTVLSAGYLRPARRIGARVVLHAHEPGDRMRDVLDRYRLSEVWGSTTLVGCSPTVCRDLADISGQEVRCLPSVPDVTNVLLRAREERRPKVDSLSLTDNPIVGACGTPDHRKGVDLWLELVEQVSAATHARFLWIGGEPPEQFEAWAARTGLGARVAFIGPLGNPYPWLAAVDVFTLTSRQDSFPLVVLEAMSLERPVVAFSVGDVAHQVGDAGRLVPAGATEEAANEVISLLGDAESRVRLGAAAAARVRTAFSTEAFTSTVQAIARQLEQ